MPTICRLGQPTYRIIKGGIHCGDTVAEEDRDAYQNGLEMLIPSREGKCCDAVIRHIERSSGSIRLDVGDPEKNGEATSVDLKVKVGDQEYALEHTRVQPFGNRIDLAPLWRTISDCVKRWFPAPLPGLAFYELHIPLDMHPPGRGKKGRERLRSLREWIEKEVDILHRRAAGQPRSPGHFYIMDERGGRPSGWKCEFRIARSNDGVVPPRTPGSFNVIIDSPDDEENPFIDEIRKAFGKKCPKLSKCKEQADDISTILILEVIEPPFVYDVHIGKHLPALLDECPAPPDDIFLVVPHRDFWEVWVVKRGEVHWADERMPMPHKGYQEVPEALIRRYPPKLAEAMGLSLLRPETRAEWRPYFPDEDKLQDLKSN